MNLKKGLLPIAACALATLSFGQKIQLIHNSPIRLCLLLMFMLME